MSTLLMLLAACALPGGPVGGPEADLDSAVDAQRPDPFAAQPDASGGLTNTSASLEAVLEYGALEGACEAWLAAPEDLQLELLCGKSMFFYEGFGAVGLPAPVFDFFGARLPEVYGEAYAAYGLIRDPYAEAPRPLGYAPGQDLSGVETLAPTCASCHFGQLPDGRYSVGAPNLDYDYGGHMLTLMLLPFGVAPGFNPDEHHPDAMAAIQPGLDALQADWWLSLELALELLPMLGAANSFEAVDVETEGHYASWAPGTMDFFIAPLPADDGVHTVSRILPLWGIPDAEEEAAAGMPHAMLGWTGNTTSIERFVDAFVLTGGGDPSLWPEERLRPLVTYIRSLRAPENPAASADTAEGEALFFEAGCADCHGGPRGAGVEVYSFDEIGSDPAMELWADPTLSGDVCCGLEALGVEPVTHGVKAPRLVGLWTMDRFLHTGGVRGLDGLLCLDGPRPTDDTWAFSDAGHDYGCSLPERDRRALITYLESI